MLETHLAIQMALFGGLCASLVTRDKERDAYHSPSYNLSKVLMIHVRKGI